MNTLTMLLLVASSETIPAQGEPPAVRVEVKRAGPDMVLRWNEVALQAIRTEKTPPPIAARNLAIMHLAIYDAVMAIERTHEPCLVDASAPAGASAEAAATAA